MLKIDTEKWEIFFLIIMPAGPSILELDLDVNSCGQVELHQPINGLGRKILDINQSLMCPDFKLLTRILVDVRRAEYSVNAPPAEQ